MADMGFKVKEDLMVVQARLAIPPSTCGNLAMSSAGVCETSTIANAGIYVEQVILNRRVKNISFPEEYALSSMKPEKQNKVSCLPIWKRVAKSSKFYIFFS